MVQPSRSVGLLVRGARSEVGVGSRVSTTAQDRDARPLVASPG